MFFVYLLEYYFKYLKEMFQIVTFVESLSE